MTALADSAVVVGYALLMVVVGGSFVRQGSSEGFFLADRTLGALRVFGTTFSTFFGTGLVFTLASFGYLYGVGAFVLPGAAVVGFLFLVRATPRIKELSDRRSAVTLPALLEPFWSDRTRALAGVVTAGLYTATLAANFRAAGTVLRALFGVSVRAGTAGFGVLVVAYTAAGGFRGVVWTDVLQTVVILASAAVALPAFVFLADAPALVDSVPAAHLDPRSLPLPLFPTYLLVGAFAFFGSQDVFQRIYAAEDAGEARRGLLFFTAALGAMGTAAVGLGIAARAFAPEAAADTALIALTDAVVPAGAVGVVLVGFLALANSDADSQLLTTASNVTHDFVPSLDAELAPRERVWLDRIAVVGVGTGALAVALSAPSLTALFESVGSWFAVLGLVVVASLFWRRTTDEAAFAGLAIGFVLPVVFVAATGNWRAATAVGLLPAAAAVVAVSFLSEPA